MVPELIDKIMKIYIKLFFFILIILLFYSIVTKAEENLLNNDRKYYVTINTKIGIPFYTSSTKFFDIYKNEFGGNTNYFKSYPEVGLAFKIQFNEIWRIALSLDYSEAYLNESYFQKIVNITQNSYRNISQDLSIRQIPVLLNLEYNPNFLTQFRTFVGAGIGLNFNATIWSEQISSDVINDNRISGVKYNKSDILGAYRLYSAVDLGFDKQTLDNFLASFIVQVNYTGYFGEYDLFGKVSKEFDNKPIELNNHILPINGYVSVNIALSFNFNKKQKTPKGN